MPVANEAEGEQTQEVAFVPLFKDDPVTRVEQQAIQRLVERVADLFNRRDWRPPQERLAEIVDQYEAEQEKRSSDSHLVPWL